MMIIAGMVFGGIAGWYSQEIARFFGWKTTKGVPWVAVLIWCLIVLAIQQETRRLEQASNAPHAQEDQK